MRTLLLAVESFLMLAWVRLVLRVSPRLALRGVLDVPSHGGAVDARLVHVFGRVTSRTPLAHNCMHRALALQRMLSRRGVAAKLCIGIGRKPNLFPGHAWLEVDGVVVNDDADVVSRYVPLMISQSALEVTYR
ncbi:MAG: Transglutaminase-like superfamily [Acidobacteriota bacterium]|jgi:hypothetical protein|nr:Transglutaminase-like superfamily [Acidobacteriota bacterium]